MRPSWRQGRNRVGRIPSSTRTGSMRLSLYLWPGGAGPDGGTRAPGGQARGGPPRRRPRGPASLWPMPPFEPLHLPVVAVVFDSDGVLVDSGDSVDRSWTRWAEERGLDAAEVIGFAHGHRSSDTV